MSRTKLLLEEVFVTEGVPEYTFVQPPNYSEILLDIRRSGKPVILEGQSGTGKTTCVRRILERIADQFETHYLMARDATHVSRIEEMVREKSRGRFVIDDFHRLSADLQTAIANLAKTAAEAADGTHLPKLVIIGINEVGSGLIQLVPDIAKRVGIHRIKPGEESQISSLVSIGCEKLNIRINPSAVFEESRGDYWLTQQLCQSICAAAGVTETSDETVELEVDITRVRQKVVDRLSAAYYPAVKEFCRGRRFRPSNDPYFKLLRAVGQQESSIVDLNELANAHEEVRGSINNIKEHRLSVLLDSKPLAGRHFHYNGETKNFAIEDPAFFYFIRHLEWDKVRQDCGFRDTYEIFDYEIALSFAGENRELAKHIADSLVELDVQVFYDETFETNFLGTAWSKQFQAIFGEKSRLVVCLLDKRHAEKIWPTFEREHFAPRIETNSVIPIYLDDTKFVGIPQDLVGIKFAFNPADERWREHATEKIVFKLIDRLG